MAYLDIVFHNVRQGGQGRMDYPDSRWDYTVNLPRLMNVYQTPTFFVGGAFNQYAPGIIGGAGVPRASLGWGNNITNDGACGIFFCESSPYPHIPRTHYHIGAWTSINQYTSPPYFPTTFVGWGAPAGSAHAIVPGWVPIPGWNCPIGTAAWPGLPVTVAANWIPPLGWILAGGAAPAFTHFNLPTWNGAGWAAPVGPGIPPVPLLSAVPDLTGIENSFFPSGGPNYVCAFLEGLPDLGPLPPMVASSLPAAANWLQKSDGNCALQCIGTGDPVFGYGGNAPPGSDRYAVYFQATNRTYNTTGNTITGLFVHTKAEADPGTQLAVLCRQFPNEIIFGDLNYDISHDPIVGYLKRDSLEAAIAATHTVLAIQNPANGNYRYTKRVGVNNWTSCIDYALVPNAYVNDVELWGYLRGIGGGNPYLDPNGSDHSVMMLRIYCN